jgi:hypothetical protein
MSDRIPSPEFEEKVRKALPVPFPASSFVNDLRSKLLSSAAQKPSPAKRFFKRPAWQWGLVILVVLLITFLAVGPQRVVAAMQKLFGYIPGVGMVSQDAPLRVLAEPVTVERDGITLTVSQVVLSVWGK